MNENINRLQTRGPNADYPPRLVRTLNSDISTTEVLQVSGQFPGEVSLNLKGLYDWSQYDLLRLRVFLPEGAGSRISVTLAIENCMWGRFRTTPAQMLAPGKWTEVQWLINSDSSFWISEEHFKVWDGYQPQDISELSLRFFCDEEYNGPIYLQPIEGRLQQDQPDLKIVRLAENSNKVGRYQKFELNFDLNRTFKNPFDPDEIDVQCVFVGPSGAPMNMFGYFTHNFIRRRKADETEEVFPVGKSYWQVRFAPLEVGEYSYQLTAKAGEDIYETTTGTFVSVASDAKGFIGWDKNDPNYFAWSNGDLHYPIGQTLRSPWDRREAYDYGFNVKEGLGTYAYDMYYEKMAECGQNFMRFWMAAWWTALEWSPGYRRDYPGLARYNLLNAWRQDYMLTQAQDYDFAFKACLQNHGQFQRRSVDHEFHDNPYNVNRGGFLHNPDEYFTDEQAKRLFKQRLRYIVARWSWMSHLQTWELWNEVDLVTGYNSSNVRDWHREMAQYLKSIDPYKHIISTHYTRRDRDANVWALKEMEFTNNNGYSQDVVEATIKTWKAKSAHKKPCMMNEYGVGDSEEELEQNFHAGMWATYSTPFCQLGIFWWWHVLHQRDWYFHYRSLVDFHGDTDFRGMKLQHGEFPVNSVGGILQSLGMYNQEFALAWIYDRRLYRERATGLGKLPIKNTSIQIDGMQPGKYKFEFWDTWKGKMLKQGTMTSGKGNVRVRIPVFYKDCILRLKLIEPIDKKQGANSEEKILNLLGDDH